MTKRMNTGAALLTAATLCLAAGAAAAQTAAPPAAPSAPPMNTQTGTAMPDATAPGAPHARKMRGAHATSSTIRPGHEPGEGESYPASNKASNITDGSTRSSIAPRLPDPRMGANASPEDYAREAAAALRRGQTGVAQEALERAETRQLELHQADQGAIPMMGTLEQARQALGRNDTAGARRILDQALASSGSR